MIIKSIHINNFCGFSEKELNFDNKLNIIEGNNESGKTTISKFIKFILFGFHDKKERNLLYPWGSKTASGSMIISDNDKNYKIYREYTEGSKETVTISDPVTGEQLYKDCQPADVFLNIPETLFVQTAYIGQEKGSMVEGKTINTEIENILLSGDENINLSKVQKKLDDARIELLYKNKNGGEIYNLEQKLDSLKQQLGESKNNNLDYITLNGELQNRNDILQNKQTQYDHDSAKLKEYKESKRKISLKKLAKIIEKNKNTKTDLDQNTNNFTYNGFTPDRNYIDKLQDIENSINTLEEQVRIAKNNQITLNDNLYNLDNINKIKDKLSDYENESVLYSTLTKNDAKTKTMGILSVLSGIFSVIGIIFTILSFINIKTPLFNYPYIYLSCNILFILLFVLFTRQKNVLKKANNKILDNFDAENIEDLRSILTQYKIDLTQYNNAETQKNLAVQTLESYNNQINEKKKEADELLSKWGKTDIHSAINEAITQLETVEELKNEYYSSNRIITTLANELNVTDYTSIMHYLNDTEPDLNISDEEIYELKTSIENTKREIEEQKSTISKIETNIAVLNATQISPAELQTKINSCKNTINELQQKHDALELAKNALNKASTEIKNNFSPKLSEKAGNIINKLSDNKYNKLGVDSSFNLTFDTNAQTHSIDYMSKGTRDIAYLSLRFALLKILFENKKSPVVFDESFSNVDDERLKNIIKLLSSLNDYQILLFTSQKRDSTIALEINNNCNVIKL